MLIGACDSDVCVQIGALQAMQFQVTDAKTRCTCVAFSKDSVMCAAGYNDGAIRTFELNQVDLESKFVPHDCAVVQIMYSLDKKVIISGNTRGVIVVSSATAGSTLRVLTDHKDNLLTTFDMAPLSTGSDREIMWLAGSADRRITVRQLRRIVFFESARGVMTKK